MCPKPLENFETPKKSNHDSPYAIELAGACKAFGEIVVLDEMDLRIQQGEIISILGPSGSGKTSILRLIMTIEEIDDGEILIFGKSLTHQIHKGKKTKISEKLQTDARLNIGMVFQHFNLFPHMSVLENICLGPEKVLNVERAEAVRRARELLAEVGLPGKEDAYPGELSGGQQQRVAIARALAMEPKIMLFDEVTSALDPELVQEVLNVLKKIALKGETTMVLVTHEMNFARHFSDRILIVDKGKIIEDGPPDQVLDNPQSDRAKQFLESILN